MKKYIVNKGRHIQPLTKQQVFQAASDKKKGDNWEFYDDDGNIVKTIPVGLVISVDIEN